MSIREISAISNRLTPPPDAAGFCCSDRRRRDVFPDGVKYKIIGAMRAQRDDRGCQIFLARISAVQPDGRFPLAGSFGQSLEFCRAGQPGRRREPAILRSRATGRYIRRKDVQDLSGRDRPSSSMSKANSTGVSSRANGAGDRLCRAAARCSHSR